MHTKPIIFMITSLLLVPLVYSSFSTNEACAAIKSSEWHCASKPGVSGVPTKECCYEEYDSKTGATQAIYCTLCTQQSDGRWKCGDLDRVFNRHIEGGIVVTKDGVDVKGGDITNDTVSRLGEVLGEGVDVKGGDITNDTEVSRHGDVLREGAEIKDGASENSNNDTKVPNDFGGSNDDGLTINPGLE